MKKIIIIIKNFNSNDNLFRNIVLKNYNCYAVLFFTNTNLLLEKN